jgi:tripartite-type tricarboxylate transporter receptor subunit TctC
MVRHALIATAFAAAAALAPSGAFAQANFPSRTVTMVVPFASGGPSEPLLRPVVERLSKLWGQPVILDNKPGANGIIGTQLVMRAPGDGHTILYHLTGMVQNALLSGDAKYDPFKDFKPVVLFGTQPLVLATSTQNPYPDVKSLLEAARKPGTNLSYGSVGAGSTYHIYGELLASKAGVPLPHVAYKGMAPLLNDLVPGRLPVSFVTPVAAVQFSKDGRLRPLGVTGTRRLRELPDVPTLAEAGQSGFELLGWYGLFLPASTPDALVERISRDVRAILQEPEMQQRLRDQYIEPVPLGPAELVVQMRSDYQKWGELIRRFNIKLE